MDSTRRTFLAAAAITPSLLPVLQPAAGDVLRVLMDIMIPASDGMPSASQAGALGYLQQLSAKDKEAAQLLTHGIETVEAFSARAFQKSFSQVSDAQKVSLLQEMETSAPAQFASLRDLIYEAYYTRPEVWKLVGYELFPANHMGPHLEPLDDSLLTEVRNRGKLFREA